MRNPVLDILRAVAIVLVFSRHSEGAPIISHLGWMGVDLFFVLSGFLVSGLLFREYQQSGAVAPGRFLIRRGFKIYPQFYLMIGVSIVAGIAAATIDRSHSLAELFFVQNYLPGLWAHTWSLAVEEHFYLLLAIAIAMLARRGGADPFRSLPRFIVIACGVILAMRIATWIAHPQPSDYVHIFPSHLRMDSLLWGVLLSYYSSFQPRLIEQFIARFGKWLPQASIACLAPAAFLDQGDPWMSTIGFTLIGIGFALLLLSVMHPAKPKPLGRAGRIMARLGTVSYAFYLWHGAVLFLDDRLLSSGVAIPVFVNLLATFAVTVAIAFATTWLAEQPFLKLRDRWFPSRAVSSGTADESSTLRAA